MTRRPARVRVETQPGPTQFTSFAEAKPCTSTIGSPCPSSRKAISMEPCWKEGIRGKIETRMRARSSPGCRGHGIALRRLALLLAGEVPQGRALDRGLGRGHETPQGHDRAEHPDRQVEGADRQQDGAAAEQLQDRT